MVFVNSMSDLFHRDVPDDYIEPVARVMATANWHTYQVLTKRAERLCELLQGTLALRGGAEHIWWGVSVEDRKHGLPRIEHLREAPARCGFCRSSRCWKILGEIDLTGIHWVIVGGESGPGARPMEREWVRSIREQCRERGVPFFFKQWGGGAKSKTGRSLDGQTYDEYPERAVSPVPDRANCLRYAAEFVESLRIEARELVQLTA